MSCLSMCNATVFKIRLLHLKLQILQCCYGLFSMVFQYNSMGLRSPFPFKIRLLWDF